jgi:hypothetical protein
MDSDALEAAAEDDVLTLVISIDEQVKLTGDIEADAKAIWLHLHKRLVDPQIITVNGAGNRAYVMWKVKRA